jgi:hypothetical protein
MFYKGDCTPASSVLGVFRTRQAALAVKQQLNDKVGLRHYRRILFTDLLP